MKESKRGCGYRKIGGTYLEGTGLAVPCDRLHDEAVRLARKEKELFKEVKEC